MLIPAPSCSHDNTLSSVSSQTANCNIKESEGAGHNDIEYGCNNSSNKL